jgi:polyphosphate kinase
VPVARDAPLHDRLAALFGPGQVPRKAYERELLRLQEELVKMAEWVRGSRPAWSCFEGREAAGKGGAIKRTQPDRVTRHLRSVMRIP